MFDQPARGASAPGSDPRFQEISRENVSDNIAQELRRLMASGALVPGERLPSERRLARLMGVSRDSVRTALQQLKAQGLVATVRGGGTSVVAAAKPLSSDLDRLLRDNLRNLFDLAELRSQIEVWAARRAAVCATPEQLREMREALAMMADPKRPTKHKAADDQRFHLAVAKAADSAVLLHLMGAWGDILGASFAFHRQELCPTTEDDRRFLTQHRAILAAIESGDATAAGDAMGQHLASVLAAFAEPAEAGSV